MIRQPLPPGRTSEVAPRTTLVVAPHFDDEVLGCGGLILRLVATGAPVHLLFLTDGSGGMEEIGDRAAYAERRSGEARAVAALLGCAGVEIAGIRDGALASARPEAAVAIRRSLAAVRPGLLLIPSPLEVSDDHRAAFASLADLLREAEADAALRDIARGLEVWLYEVNHPGYPDRLVDVSDCRGTLERAMAIYASQEERHPYLRAGLGLREFRTHTLSPAVELAEGYRRLAGADFAGRELGTLVAELGGSVSEVLDRARRAEDERDRLAALVREMEGTRAWRLHRFVERLRGNGAAHRDEAGTTRPGRR